MFAVHRYQFRIEPGYVAMTLPYDHGSIMHYPAAMFAKVKSDGHNAFTAAMFAMVKSDGQ